MNELGENSIFGPEPCAYTLTRQFKKLNRGDRGKIASTYQDYIIAAKEIDMIENNKTRMFITNILINDAKNKILKMNLNTHKKSILSDDDLKYIKDALFYCVKTRLAELYD